MSSRDDGGASAARGGSLRYLPLPTGTRRADNGHRQKGKVLIELGGAAAIARRLAGRLSALAQLVGVIDAHCANVDPSRGGGSLGASRDGVVILWTLDEARAAVVAFAAALLEGWPDAIWVPGPTWWGAGAMEGLSPLDQVLSRRHRRLLDAPIDQVFAWVPVDKMRL